MESTGRIFTCVRCFKQVIICSRCDRGQRYCSPDCSETARNHSQRAASHRYQQSREGRIKHALRMRLYRLRQQIVTHQGSQSSAPNGLLQANSTDARKSSVTLSASGRQEFSMPLLRLPLFGICTFGFSSASPGSLSQPIRPKRKPK